MYTLTTFSLRERSSLLFLASFLLLFACDQSQEQADPLLRPSTPSANQAQGLARQPGKPGGRLVAALRAEPKTFNPIIATDTASLAVINRMVGDLVHINRYTQEPEPAVAESWSISEDGRRYTLTLRRGVRFSDGHLLDADDVLFSFRVYLDEDMASAHRDKLIVNGQPIAVKKINPHTVEFEFPLPYAVGVRIFDSLAILPEHRLGESFDEGDLSRIWDLAAEPEEIVGLGPFRLKEFVPGRHCVLRRNRFYWKSDEAGASLPYLDELAFIFVPNDEAQAIRFQVGDGDVVDRLSAMSFMKMEQESRGRGYRLFDLGPGLNYNFLFFNLNDLSLKASPELVAKQLWFQEKDFRRAVSAAIDRNAIVKLVYQGKATPLGAPISPGNKHWFNKSIQATTHSIEEARNLLGSAGFTWDGDGALLSPLQEVVEFSVVTSSSNTQRMTIATIIQEDLSAIGIRLQIVPIEHRSLIEKLTRSLDYEAAIMEFGGGDADPNGQFNMLVTTGNLHVWHLGQRAPSTSWEAEIDRLMKLQLTVIDSDHRREIFDEVQRIMAEHVPLIPLVSPHLLVGAKVGLGNFTPAVLAHQTLWNSDELFWQTAQ